MLLEVHMDTDYELVQVQSVEDWETYHRIRREELFADGSRPRVYDAMRPEEFLPANYPLLLKWNGVGIATTRLDVHAGGLAIVRLVAVTKSAQGQGHGRALSEMVEAFARTLGVRKFALNARVSAVGYYRRLGYGFESWDPAELASTSDNCVQMSKML